MAGRTVAVGVPVSLPRPCAGRESSHRTSTSMSCTQTLRYAHLSPRYLADEVKTLDKYHGTDNPTGGTGIDGESTPKEVASPEAGEPLEVDSDGSSKPPRKPRPQAVKADKPGLPMQGIGKK